MLVYLPDHASPRCSPPKAFGFSAESRFDSFLAGRADLAEFTSDFRNNHFRDNQGSIGRRDC